MFMKWLIRLAFPALGVLLMLIFFGLSDPTAPTEEASTAATTENIPDFEGLVPAEVPTEGPDIIFKWQDRDGSWHYADQPPETGNWNTLAIEPGQATPTREPLNPGPMEEDLEAPYSAPFALDPRFPQTGS